MGSFGGFEWLIIILILILFFGAKKIPDMARGISRGIYEFRKASKDEENEKTLKEEENSSDQAEEQK